MADAYVLARLGAVSWTDICRLGVGFSVDEGTLHAWCSS
jgi:hypothetical protein